MTREDLQKTVKVAKKMNINKEYSSPEFGKLCMTVVELIERSDFGRNNAEATLSLEPLKSNWYDQMLDDSFDGVAMQLLDIAEDSLGNYGTLSVIPYTKGLSTRSATIRFKRQS